MQALVEEHPDPDRETGWPESPPCARMDWPCPTCRSYTPTSPATAGVWPPSRSCANTPATTAIVALNDAMAMGVLSALRERGVPVPDRISVAGFDDVSVAADLAPGLTTVRLPMTEMGRMALTLALKPRRPPATPIHRTQPRGKRLHRSLAVLAVPPSR